MVVYNTHLQHSKGWVVYAGRRSVTREGRKYKVYLPVNLNDLWEELKGRKVKVYLVVDDD